MFKKGNKLLLNTVIFHPSFRLQVRKGGKQGAIKTLFTRFLKRPRLKLPRNTGSPYSNYDTQIFFPIDMFVGCYGNGAISNFELPIFENLKAPSFFDQIHSNIVSC